MLGEHALVSALQPMLGEVLVDSAVVVVGDDDPARAVLDDPDTSWLADGLATGLSPCSGASW